MNRRIAKQLLVSIGIALIISAPISAKAMQSWDSSAQVEEKGLPEDFRWTHGAIESKAHECFEAEQKRQEEAELQEAIWIQQMEAMEVLDEYGVNVPWQIRDYCEEAQEEFNVCAELLEAIAWRESRFDESAKNSGCLGLMQINVKWHKGRMERLGVTDIYDAQSNIRVGADYLAELLEKHDGDIDRALMEYNGDTREGISKYATDILEISAALERVHGK